MSLQKIIKESVEKNPLGLKEALEEELRNRVALALEAKMKEEDDYDDDDDDDEDDEDEELEEATKTDLMKQLDKDFPNFKVGKVASVNAVAKFLQQKGFKQNAAMKAAVDFENYKKGEFKEQYDLDEASYNKDAVDKAISSADKKGKPTSSKGKKLIHALLKGHSVKENLDDEDLDESYDAIISKANTMVKKDQASDMQQAVMKVLNNMTDIDVNKRIKMRKQIMDTIKKRNNR